MLHSHYKGQPVNTICVWCESHAVPHLHDVMPCGTQSDSSGLQVREIPNAEFTVNSVVVSGWPLALMNSAPPLSAAIEHCPANMATTCQILNGRTPHVGARR
jgi:hypothetical protein